MSAADVVLFSLSFLACALLAAWIRSVTRERDRFPRHVPARVRDPELTRLSGSLDSALARIEALEGRNQDLERQNETLTRLVHSRVAAEATAPGSSGPAAGSVPPWGSVSGGSVSGDSVSGDSGQGAPAAAVPVPDEDVDSVEEQEEVSPSQWRSAMDRLGPVWPSGTRSAEAVPRSASAGGGQTRPPSAPPEPGTPSGSAGSDPAPSGSAPGSLPSGSEPDPIVASGAGAPGEQDGPGAQASPWSTLSSAALTAGVRRAAPLDDLFPPAGAVGGPSPATDAPRNGTAREPGGPAVP